MAQNTKENRRAKGDGTVFQLSNGHWRAQLTIGTKPDGRPKKTTRTTLTKSDAYAALNQMRIEQSTGLLTVQSDIKFHEYTARWMKWKRPSLKAKTLMEYEQVTRTVLLPQFGQLSISKLDTGRIDTFLQEKISTGYAPKTVKKYKTILHNILGRAVAEGVINRNPVDYCMSIRQSETKRTVIEKEDISRILAAAREITQRERSLGRCHGQSFFCYPVLMTAYHTGMRIGEIFALRWENIDLDKRVIHVRENVTEAKDEHGKMRLIQDTPKTANSIRDIDISNTLRDVLSEIRPYASTDAGIVFTTKADTYIAPSNFGEVWRKMLRNLGMKGKYTVHEFRHTHATMLMAQGINPVSISKRLGHSSPQTTLNVYSHPVKADGRRMADTFDTSTD